MAFQRQVEGGPSPVQQLQSACNRFTYAMRNFLHWELGTLQEPAFEPETLFEGLTLPARQTAQNLLKTYAPDYSLAPRMSMMRLRENLTYLHWLACFYEQAPGAFHALAAESSTLHWLDVGAKNWSYVNALDAFIRKHFPQPYRLDGVELDPHRRYLSGKTRGQSAKSYIGGLVNAQYHAMDIRDWRLKAQVITHFLPFLAPETHLAWGLPLQFYKPQAILTHLIKTLHPGGVLMVVNQGEWEAETQAQLFRAVGREQSIQVQALGQLPVHFIQYRYPRYGWLCQKQPE